MSDRAQVEFAGEQFRASETGIPLAALMRFAHAAKGGADANDMDGLDAMYRLLSWCIHPDEWDRFLNTAEKCDAKGDALMGVVGKVIEAKAARPTVRPSDSSDGPTSIEPSSEDVSSSAEPSHLRVMRHWEAKGRPDVAYMVQMAQAS